MSPVEPMRKPVSDFRAFEMPSSGSAIWALRGSSKSVQVLLNGIEAVIELTSILLE